MLGLSACATRSVPDHDGYRNAAARQAWEKPTVLEFDEDNEAEVDGELSYPNRRRARWYAVELPDSGNLDVRLDYLPLGEESDEVDIEDEDDPFDVGFEVYDSGYKQLVRADRDEEDAGEDSKRRTLEDLSQGQYLVHVFVQRRLDEVDFTLRMQFRPRYVAAKSDFPRNVAFVDPLPQVPQVDDAPPPEPPRCRGRRCRDRESRRPSARNPRPPTTTPAPSADAIKGRIIGARGTSEGTRITINRGSAHGIERGRRGRVVTRSGSNIANGSFTIVQVKTRESYAVVGASTDAVISAAHVRIEQ